MRPAHEHNPPPDRTFMPPNITTAIISVKERLQAFNKKENQVLVSLAYLVYTSQSCTILLEKHLLYF